MGKASVMADNANKAPEDLGAPVAYLVLKNGTPAYDRAGDSAGTVEHVLADEHEDVFHGLILKTGHGHRYASSNRIDGIFEHGFIVAVPAAQLPEPSEETVAAAGADDKGGLHRAWRWLVDPK